MVSIKLFSIVAASFFAIIAALILLSFWRELLWREERQDLYNRIMSGSLTDYRNDIPEKPPPKGGNMYTAGMKRAARLQIEALQMKEGDS